MYCRFEAEPTSSYIYVKDCLTRLHSLMQIPSSAFAMRRTATKMVMHEVLHPAGLWRELDHGSNPVRHLETCSLHQSLYHRVRFRKEKDVVLAAARGCAQNEPRLKAHRDLIGCCPAFWCHQAGAAKALPILQASFLPSLRHFLNAKATF